MAKVNITARVDPELKRTIVSEARDREMSISEFAGLLLSSDVEVNTGLTGEDLDAIRSILRDELEQEISTTTIQSNEGEDRTGLEVILSTRILRVIDHHLEKLSEAGIESSRAEFVQRAVLQSLKSEGVHWDNLLFRGGLYAKSARFFESCLINEEKRIK